MTMIAGLSLSSGMIGMVLLVGPDRARQVMITNLQRGLLRTDPEAADRKHGARRRSGLAALALRLAPRTAVQRIDRLLSRAGRPRGWPVERVLVAKPVLAVLAGGLGLLVVGSNPQPLIIVIAIVVAVASYFVPELLLHSRAQERSQQIVLELADTLDQMTIAVEAGLGFDAAMARAGRNGRGPLAEELVRTLQDVQMGSSRRQAYESLAARTDAADLRRFVRAVIQADAYGISIADVLRTQAAEMRRKRRQRAEEKAMQIPVKVVFPLMFCILPVLLIVTLAPVVMNLMKTFA
ncbi:type II secretion system F family protein [Microlunatus sp. Gsoil 973]|nr:type II secretion system F family protein [Microlunatus sp. Gsoil 973]